jgi:succinate dehydrogenase / fumarate reductase flavoprotein subunit
MSLERHSFDVVIVGAGGAGLRAAIEARENGMSVAIISKSMFGKAHTVMAEGGIAASMGNVNGNDNWQVHFRDTMRGSKFHNNWRMAQLHAQESPDRVWELETWGALFDRTKDGRISQRNFGGHEYPRLAHVGDRTGLELIRTLQQKIVQLQQKDKTEFGEYEAKLKVFQECTITEILKDETTGHVSGAFGYWRENGNFVVFEAKAVIIATGGLGKSFKVTSNSWEGTGDGVGLALKAGGQLVDMEFVQFHPTGMVWPPSVKGILVTESVRGEGGVLTNSEGKRFMFDYIPEVFKDKYADTEAEADRWYEDPDNNRRPPELLPRDEVARAINTEVKSGRGSENGGVYLDVSKRLSSEVIKRRLPAMYHQFKELADVDITQAPMEVGPTCHYVMGGIQVESDTAAAIGVAGLFAAGEVAGGMHGANRLGGNSLSDLLVFGKRAGAGAVGYVSKLSNTPKCSDQAIDKAKNHACAPLENKGSENPYSVHQDLQQVMNDLVGIIRTGTEMDQALARLKELKARIDQVSVPGGKEYNPGWHLALDLENMLLVSEAIAKSGNTREESRGGHTRDDFTGMDPNWRNRNVVCRLKNGSIEVATEPISQMPPELAGLFEASELKKYFTAEEYAQLPKEVA